MTRTTIDTAAGTYTPDHALRAVEEATRWPEGIRTGALSAHELDGVLYLSVSDGQYMYVTTMLDALTWAEQYEGPTTTEGEPEASRAYEDFCQAVDVVGDTAVLQQLANDMGRRIAGRDGDIDQWVEPADEQ